MFGSSPLPQQPSSHILGMRKALSAERLTSYRAHPGESPLDITARYCWNMALAEAMYPALQCLEVALRNAVHDAISAAPFTPTGAPVGEFWFRDASILVAPKSRQLALNAETDLAHRG